MTKKITHSTVGICWKMAIYTYNNKQADSHFKRKAKKKTNKTKTNYDSKEEREMIFSVTKVTRKKTSQQQQRFKMTNNENKNEISDRAQKK